MSNLIIPLEVVVKNSILDGKMLVENININILNKLILNEKNLLKKYECVSKNDIYENEFIKRIYETEKEQLKKYAENIKFGKAFTRYDKTRNMGGFGRVFPYKSLGLFSFRKEIRGALAYGKYIDIDLINAHPSILLQLCISNNIKCDNLKKYVDDRDCYLNLVINEYNVNRTVAKDLFIILLYFGSFKRWADENNVDDDILPIIKDLKNELKQIGEILIKNNKNLVKIIENKINSSKTKKKKNNIVGSVVSFILCEYECQILEQLFIYCTNKEIINNNCVLCADGIMIPADKYYDDLINEFNAVIKQKLGFNLKFAKKELNTDIFNLL